MRRTIIDRRGAALTSTFLLISLLSLTVRADVIDDLKPGEWYEVPNSRLDAVKARQEQFPWLAGNISGVIDCWAGGAFDSQRDRLYIGPGGGHAGYNGNEVYCFDLKDLKWRRLNDPDPVIPGTEHVPMEKAPFAMHTYDGVEYLPPPVDRYVIIGGWGTPRTYAMDPDRPDRWEVFADHGTHRTGDLAAYDPADQLLWLSTPITAGKLSQWDPFTKQWTLRRRESPEPSYYETADVDYKRRVLVSCGKGKLKVWRLAGIPTPIAVEQPKVTGDAAVMDAPSPGFCYAPLLDHFVAWDKGADVYTLDFEAKRWTKHPPAATNKVVPSAPSQWGTFGRFRYVASRNVFILCNAVDKNVFLYRLTADRPNVITAVEATAAVKSLETDLPAAAVTVHAVYADGTRKDVTAQANYFSLDPAVAQVDLRGKGVVAARAAGTARVKAAYADPAFQRGFASEVSIPVRDIFGESTLDKVEPSFSKVTLVAGDAFQLTASGAYSRGKDRFTRDCTSGARWTTDSPQTATAQAGLITAVKPGNTTVRAEQNGKRAAVQVEVVEAPVIRRISFGIKDTPPRTGWLAENGKPFTDARGYGWLDGKSFTTRDDRASAKHLLLMRFVKAEGQKFRLNVPPGAYTVRVAMGDADYGAPSFETWTALGEEKIVYDEGRKNSVATRVAQAGDDGLVFTVNGAINYLVAAPVGIDLDKYADDGPGDVANTRSK